MDDGKVLGLLDLRLHMLGGVGELIPKRVNFVLLSGKLHRDGLRLEEEEGGPY